MNEVNYEQGMTKVWSDGEKIVVTNTSGIKHVEYNVEQIFGMGEWYKIQNVAYSQVNEKARNVNFPVRTYERVSGYIPQRVIDDLAEQPDEASEDVIRANALEALKNL